MAKLSSFFIIVVLLLSATPTRFAVAFPGTMQLEAYPWQLLGQCSDTEVYLSQSRSTAAGPFRKVNLRGRNLNDFAVDLSVTPRVRTNDGQDIVLASQTVRLNAGQDLAPSNTEWETAVTDTSASSINQIQRVVAWGFDEVKVKKVESDVPAVSCTVPITLTLTASIAAILNELSSITVDRDNVPPAARDKLIQLKDQIAALLVAAANQTAAADPSRLRTLVAEMLQLEGVTLGHGSGPPFGAIHELKVESPGGHPELLAATVVFSLPGSDDTSLRLLVRNQGSWRSALAVENRGYQKIGGALGRVAYAVSPAVAGQQSFVVVVDITALGDGGALSIRHRVYLPATDSGNPTLIDEDAERYCGTQGTVPSFGVLPDGNGIVIRYSDGSSRPVAHQPLIKYAFQNGQVRKVTSLEQSAREFIDEWVSLPSAQQAALLIDPIATEIVNCRRGALQAMNFRPSAQENTIRACPTDRCQFQMKVHRSDFKNPNLFFTVVRRQDGFHAQHINNVQPVRCDVKAP